MFQAHPIPAFNDNYIWLLSRPPCRPVAVVDPGDAGPVLQYLNARELSLETILITHHHADHTGGVAELVRATGARVVGPKGSPFEGIDTPLDDGDTLEVLGQRLTVKRVPGHTLDHLCYYHLDGRPQALVGDTLFLAGCGRLFEGTPEQMLAAMRFFAQLPEATEVYCTHEYSLANLAFARAVEPDNGDIQAATARCQALRDRGRPTLPTHIGEEKRINPFLRTAEPGVIAAARRRDAQASGPEQVFAAIRAWKNSF